MIILTILAVLLVFTFLVVIHEFGHFVVARRNGVRVDEFGVGFPPRLWGKKRGGVLYSVNALPLGGFVKIKGETGDDKSKDSFSSQTTWVKTKILLAGVGMNLLFAYLALTVLAIVGMPPVLPGKMPSFGPVQPHAAGSEHLLVLQVSETSPAAQAGIKSGDWIMSYNGQPATSTEALRTFTKENAGQTVTVVTKNNGREETKQITLAANPQDSSYLGVATMPEQFVHYDLWAAPIAAFILVLQLIWGTLAAFGGLITGIFLHAKVGENVTGPIGITAIFSQILKFGWRYVLSLMAVISMSLAVVNALPIPALDGGRLLMVLVNRTGMKVDARVENLIHIAGFAVLIILMVVVSIADISRLR